MVSLTNFSPDDPIPNPAIAEEIEMLRSEICAFGISDPHRAVLAWLGKPNPFSGAIMHTPQQVLDFFNDQIKATTPQQRAIAPQHTTDQTRETVVKAEKRAERAEAKAEHITWLQAVEKANAEWREAVEQRGEAIRQWDSWVRMKREIFQSLKKEKP